MLHIESHKYSSYSNFLKMFDIFVYSGDAGCEQCIGPNEKVH